MKRFIGQFHVATTLMRDVGVWLALITFVLGSSFIERATTLLENQWLGVALGFVFFLIIAAYTILRTIFLHRRAIMQNEAMHYIHRLSHDVRDRVSKNFLDLAKGHNRRDYEKECTLMLEAVLMNAANCFRKLTGDPKVVASLLMPSNGNRNAMQTQMYCRDTPAERKKSSRPQTNGLAFSALHSDVSLIYQNYSKEPEFQKTRDSWQWYAAGIMTPFKVFGRPWGILNIDSKKTNIFRKDWREIACGFADACGLIFALMQCGSKEGAPK